MAGRVMNMLKDKKGVEMTISTIIIIVLVIVVLIVLVMIFTRSSQNFFKGTSDCTSKGGTCESPPCQEGYTVHFAGNPSCSKDQVCCIAEKTILGQE
jgi:hypothetical protein